MMSVEIKWWTTISIKIKIDKTTKIIWLKWKAQGLEALSYHQKVQKKLILSKIKILKELMPKVHQLISSIRIIKSLMLRAINYQKV